MDELTPDTGTTLELAKRATWAALRVVAPHLLHDDLPPWELIADHHRGIVDLAFAELDAVDIDEPVLHDRVVFALVNEGRLPADMPSWEVLPIGEQLWWSLLRSFARETMTAIV